MVPPVPFTRLVGPALTTSFVEVSESTYERGFEQPLHAHDPAYITAVLSGSYEERAGSTSRDVAQGALLYHPPGEEHAVRFRAPVTRAFRLLPLTAMLEAQRLTRTRFEHMLGTSDRARHIVQRMRDCYMARNPLAPLIMDSLACELLAACTPNRGVADIGHGGARYARDIIEARLDRVPSLHELAGQVGCHPITLTRAFRRTYGTSIGGYVRRRRVEEAGRMLQQTDLPLAAVAHSCGFADQAHMTREMRKQAGYTPGALRAFNTGPDVCL
jgi:AraC family transcriptional regulator